MAVVGDEARRQGLDLAAGGAAVPQGTKGIGWRDSGKSPRVSPVSVAAGSRGLVPAYLARGLQSCMVGLQDLPLYRQALFELAWRAQNILECIASMMGLFFWLDAGRPWQFASGGLQAPPARGGCSAGWPGAPAALWQAQSRLSPAASWGQPPVGASAIWSDVIPAGAGAAGGPTGSLLGPSEIRGVGDANARGLFAAYLASGLEVVREFTVRVQCLAAVPSSAGVSLAPAPLARAPLAPILAQAASWRSQSALLAARAAELESGIVELRPLLQLAVTGLAGWVCLSRDLDEAGVVQREQALRRLVGELCAALLALRELLPLRASGALELSQAGVGALAAAEEEARRGLEQLAVCFEGAGLWELDLPPRLRGVLAELAAA